MNVEKTKNIREGHKAFVYKMMENAEKILTDGGEDLSSKKKLTALKSLLAEKIGTRRSACGFSYMYHNEKFLLVFE